MTFSPAVGLVAIAWQWRNRALVTSVASRTAPRPSCSSAPVRTSHGKDASHDSECRSMRLYDCSLEQLCRRRFGIRQHADKLRQQYTFYDRGAAVPKRRTVLEHESHPTGNSAERIHVFVRRTPQRGGVPEMSELLVVVQLPDLHWFAFPYSHVTVLPVSQPGFIRDGVVAGTHSAQQAGFSSPRRLVTPSPPLLERTGALAHGTPSALQTTITNHHPTPHRRSDDGGGTPKNSETTVVAAAGLPLLPAT